VSEELYGNIDLKRSDDTCEKAAAGENERLDKGLKYRMIRDYFSYLKGECKR
jgi:hypothetical protein